MLLEGLSVVGVLPGASMAVGSTLVAVDRAVVGASSGALPGVGGALTVNGLAMLNDTPSLFTPSQRPND